MACVNDVDFASFAERLAEVSSEVILPFFRSEIGAEDKSDGGDFDPVAEADRAAEVVMRHLIRETFPDHGIIGEEYGAERSEADHVWVLDPIDGTKSFISGLPTWGTLIGLMKFGQPVYGMMSQPFTRERYFGDNLCSRRRWVTPSRGDSANGEWSSRVLRSRACASLTQASLMTTSPLLFNEQDRAAYRRLEKVARLVTAEIVTHIACSRPALSMSSSKPTSSPMTLSLSCRSSQEQEELSPIGKAGPRPWAGVSLRSETRGCTRRYWRCWRGSDRILELF
jgi:fructose-1,6-bisphosphatase/inositol monophosphatase family enzyme